MQVRYMSVSPRRAAVLVVDLGEEADDRRGHAVGLGDGRQVSGVG
jgi:hypothetical protein